MTEEKSAIQFFCEDVPMPDIESLKTKLWLTRVAESENSRLDEVNIIFCSDEYLYRLNVEHLNHDTFTDIITFPFSETSPISGDLFISTERVEENAEELSVSFEEELHRVMVHGLLHLVGYGDKLPGEKKEMTAKENHYLEQRFDN
nr:rRNA maturation RNase YbeY [Saprospiraceae bacterium]